MKFVIWALSFTDNTGGVIALHSLCSRLRGQGHEAYIWEEYRPPFPTFDRFPGLYQYLRYGVYRYIRYHLSGRRARFNLGPFGNRSAQDWDLDDAVVIYPEIVNGNPLRALKYVRWLLNHPRTVRDGYDYRKDDVFFYFMDAFAADDLGFTMSGLLYVTWNHPAYREVATAGREGTSYILRKGKDRPLQHALDGSVCVDGLSHEETAAVFKSTERFYSYDLYTRYYIYAAVCGCTPIVVPEDGVSEEAWMPDEQDRYGIAYGEQRAGWARETRPLMFDKIARDHDREERTIREFVATCERLFPRLDYEEAGAASRSART